MPVRLLDALGLSATAPNHLSLYINFGVDASFPDMGLTSAVAEEQTGGSIQLCGHRSPSSKSSLDRCRRFGPTFKTPVDVVKDLDTVGHVNKTAFVDGQADYTQDDKTLWDNVASSNKLTSADKPAINVMITTASLGTAVGISERGSVNVVISAQDGTNYPQTLTHELGHVAGVKYLVPDTFVSDPLLGLPSPAGMHWDRHSNIPRYVMDPSANPDVDQVVDVRWCREIWKLAKKQTETHYWGSGLTGYGFRGGSPFSPRR